MPPEQRRIEELGIPHGIKVHRIYARLSSEFDREYYDETLERLEILRWGSQMRSPAALHFEYGYVVVLEAGTDPGAEVLRDLSARLHDEFPDIGYIAFRTT